MKAHITIKDVANKQSSMVLNGLDKAMATPGAALLSFVSTIQAFFNGLLVEYYALVPDAQVLSIPAVNAPYASSLHKGLITAGFPVADETHYRGIWMPAPNLDRFDHVSGVGYRMSSAALSTFETALNTVSNTVHSVRQGVLEYKEGRQAKPNEGGYLVMEDALSRPAFMKVPDVTDKVKLAAFAATLTDAVTPFTNCGITQAVVLTRSGGVRTGTPTAEEGHDSVELRCKLHFSYPVGSKKHTFTLNAPTLKSTSLESAAGADAKRVRVKETTGDAIAAALTTLYTGAVRTVTFEGGWADKKSIK